MLVGLRVSMRSPCQLIIVRVACAANSEQPSLHAVHERVLKSPSANYVAAL